MNEYDQTNAPSPIAVGPGLNQLPGKPKPKPLSWWLRKFFACNPFYLVSAALLLYGCYRVSLDAPFFRLESARLIFNFTSVQAYEILLVLVAIFLASRSLWYDSTLLVGLENLLVFVPFILISQAALMDGKMAGIMCAAGVTVAVLRFASLKKYFTELNLPGRVLGVGFVLLAINVALPLAFRHFGETKIGIHIDSGPAYEMNERAWLLILPAAIALANFLPGARGSETLLPQRRWLPAGMFALWIAVTCVHLYGLDYIYQFDLRSELLAPAAWVLAWTAYLRFRTTSSRVKHALTLPALLTPLLATSPGGTKTYLILAALNMVAYGEIGLLDRRNRLAVHLFYGSAMMLVAGVPNGWLHVIVPGVTQAECVAAGLTAYMIFWAAWLPNPKLAVLGAMAFGVGIMALFRHHEGAGYWALQGALVFLLLHSLRWDESLHPGANTTRILTAAAWIIQSFCWVNSDSGRFWMPFIPGFLVLGIYVACLLARGKWLLYIIPLSSGLVILSGPCCAAVRQLRETPIGLLAIVASFLFLGFGTIAALTRDLWHKHEVALEEKGHNSNIAANVSE